MGTRDDNESKSENPSQPEKKHSDTPHRKKVPFYRSVLPWKGDSRKAVVYKILSLLAVLVFLGSAGYLLNDLVIQPAIADREQQDIKKLYYPEPQPASSASQSQSETAVSSAPPERDAQGRLIRFVQLQKVNPDIVGWINIPNTIIDLPVLQANAKDPEFYLDHDYNKNYSKFGSIFADAKSKAADGKTKSTILYGHSLNSGRMFTQLNKYKDYSFLKQNPVFTFDTVKDTSQWKIISVILTNTLPDQGVPFNYMRTDFKSDGDYLNFVYQLRIRSLFNTGVSFRADDRILLLSTCSYEFTDFREVVVARRVRSGESTAVDETHILYNNKAVYPDCWYKKYGGSRPQWPDTYEQAVKNKVLAWSENE